MKILVLGPKGVGKTTFINKMFSDYDMVKDFILESDEPIDSVDDVVRSYLILPRDEVLRERCSNLNIEDEVDKWVGFYNNKCKDYTMTWVSDF